MPKTTDTRNPTATTDTRPSEVAAPCDCSAVWWGRATELQHLARWADENSRERDAKQLRAVAALWAQRAQRMDRQNDLSEGSDEG